MLCLSCVRRFLFLFISLHLLCAPRSYCEPHLSSAVMTSILLACGATCSDRMRLKYNTRRQDKKDYANRFEELKAENARRQSFIDSYTQSQPSSPQSSASTSTTELNAATSPRTRSAQLSVLARSPPSYEVATSRPSSAHTRSYATSRTNSPTSWQ